MSAPQTASRSGSLRTLHDPAYKALPERAEVIAVAALDWNCPKHLPECYTLAELEPAFAQTRAELHRLRAENAALKAAAGDLTPRPADSSG